jgi:hypothetical protein
MIPLIFVLFFVLGIGEEAGWGLCIGSVAGTP